LSDQADKDAAEAAARRTSLTLLRLICTDMLPNKEVMEKACAFFLTAPCKKTPAMIELLNKKDKTYEEEAEIRAVMRVAYAEAKAEAEREA